MNFGGFRFPFGGGGFGDGIYIKYLSFNQTIFIWRYVWIYINEYDQYLIKSNKYFICKMNIWLVNQMIQKVQKKKKK